MTPFQDRRIRAIVRVYVKMGYVLAWVARKDKSTTMGFIKVGYPEATERVNFPVSSARIARVYQSYKFRGGVK